MKEQLEKLVLQMYRSGIRYSEAVREFQRVFILTLCAGLLAYRGEVKAQSVVIPSAKETRSDHPKKVSVTTRAAVKAQSVVVPSAKGTRSDHPNKLAVTTLAGGRTSDFIVDRLDLVALRIAATYEDCGPDKGKCSGTGHCCLIGGSGWCCPQDKKCGEEIGNCRRFRGESVIFWRPALSTPPPISSNALLGHYPLVRQFKM